MNIEPLIWLSSHTPCGAFFVFVWSYFLGCAPPEGVPRALESKIRCLTASLITDGDPWAGLHHACDLQRPTFVVVVVSSCLITPENAHPPRTVLSEPGASLPLINVRCSVAAWSRVFVWGRLPFN